MRARLFHQQKIFFRHHVHRHPGNSCAGRHPPGAQCAGRHQRANVRDLTARECQILAMIGSGMKNREIGEVLALAEKTIRRSVTSILQKLQVHGRGEAALLAATHVASQAK